MFNGAVEIYAGTLIGNYIFFPRNANSNYWLRRVSIPVEPDVEVKSENYDRILRQSLGKLLRERTLSIGEQTKELNQNDTIGPILEREPILSRQFSKEELAKISLLWIAVLGCYRESAELLVRSGADVNELFGCHEPRMLDEKCTILHVLLQMEPTPENERLIRLVMDHGPDLQARDSKGQTVLHIAVWQGRAPMIEMLLEAGVDVNVADRDYSFHYQLLRMAVLCESSKLVKLALDRGANVNAQACIDGRFPLYLVVNKPCITDASIEVLRTLLERGANVHLRTIKGRTALHRACKFSTELFPQREMAIGLLLSAGADALAEDNYGNTPFALVDHHSVARRSRYTNASSIRPMIKALALKKVCQPSVELRDESIMKLYYWNYYRDCIAHASRMKLTRLIKSCTFLELLAKSHYQTVELMRNPNFEANFELYDLSGFSMYAEDIRRAFTCAQNQHLIILKQEELIDEAVGHILPYTVVRKIVNYTFDDCYARLGNSLWHISQV